VLGYSRVGLRWPHGRPRTPVGGPSQHWGGVLADRFPNALPVFSREIAHRHVEGAVRQRKRRSVFPKRTHECCSQLDVNISLSSSRMVAVPDSSEDLRGLRLLLLVRLREAGRVYGCAMALKVFRTSKGLCIDAS
jgi:hypothetical protein